MKILFLTAEMPFVDESETYIRGKKKFTLGGIANAAGNVVGNLAPLVDRLDVLSLQGLYTQPETTTTHEEGTGTIYQYKDIEPTTQSTVTTDEMVDRRLSFLLDKSTELIKKNNYDAILTFGGLEEPMVPYLLNLAKTHFGLDKSIPYVLSLRGIDVPHHDPIHGEDYHGRYLNLISQIWKDAEAIICNSRFLADEAQSYAPSIEDKMHIIPNGIDARLLDIQNVPRKEGPLRLVSTSRIAKIKGLEYAIRAIGALDEDVQSQIVYDIYGYDRGEQEHLQGIIDEANIGERVQFKGPYSNEDLPSILPDYDIFVLPSIREGDANGLKQAMAAGLPVIATRVGAVPTLIGTSSKEMSGYTVPVQDRLALANAIHSALDMREKLPKMGVAARSVVADMTWGSIAQMYKEILYDVTNK